MATSQDRERIIRAAWEERGKAEWNPETHGRGLLSLNIPATVEVRPVRFGAPLPPYDNLEFRLVRATMSGQPVNSIVCEGVVVETLYGNASQPSSSSPSGITVVVPPQEQQPQTVGLSAGMQLGSQGRATLTVAFADDEAVTGWLNAQSEDVAVVFAARAALRVLPAITFSRWPGTGRKTTRNIVLRVFRAVATAWAVAAYPSHRKELNAAARAALSGLGDLKAPSPIRAAAYASAAATGEPGATRRASTVIDYALDAAESKRPEALKLLLEALATDAGLLSERFSAVTLAHSQLWPGQIPDWVRTSWGELKSTLLDADENWEIWTNWYEERLAGDTTDQDMEIARVSIDNNVWRQGPRLVNAHIKGLIEGPKIFQDALADEPENLPNADAIPRQTAAASQFALDAQGQLDLLPDAPLPDDMQRETYQEVRYKALALSGLGHNQLAGMSEPVARFLAAAPEHIEDVQITRLWSRGNTLRRRLKAHDTAATSADPTDPAILSTSVAEMLRDLVESYNVFIVGDPSGRELDQVRLGPQERQAAEVALNLALPIAEAVQLSEGLATATAIEALTEQLEAARLAPSGIDGDQAVDLSRKTTANFIAELLRAAYARVRAEPGFAWKEIRAGTYRYAGPALIAGGYISPIVTFVAAQGGNLKLFVEQAFHNPTLVQIIELISKVVAAN
jgi:hypothetical protein